MRESVCVHEGTCYPSNHVTAAFDSRTEADAAAAALAKAGFIDVGLFHGLDAYQAIQDASRRSASLTRVWRRFRRVGGEGEQREHFLATLRAGGSYLIVRADSS